MIKEFDGIKLSDEWAKLIDSGVTNFYSNGCSILNYHTHNGICVINSISLKDDNFPKKMLKDVIILAKANKNVIITSTVLKIKPYMKRHGFIYNNKTKAYEKGVTWE